MAVRKKRGVSCPNCGSQIVHHTDLILKEKIKAYFIPTEMYKCQPCGTRFARYGNPLSRKKNRRILVTLVLAIIVPVSILVMVTGNGESPGEKKVETNQLQQVKKTPQPETVKERDEEINPETPRENPGQETAAVPVKTIKLGNSRRFGVNWEYNGSGLAITRLSPGPLLEAGFKIGDVLVSLDGEPLIDDTKLLRFRNEIFSGIRQEAVIEAVSEEKKIIYKLIK